MKARRLQRLGLHYVAIARWLGVTGGKTVRKAIACVDRESIPQESFARRLLVHGATESRRRRSPNGRC